MYIFYYLSFFFLKILKSIFKTFNLQVVYKKFVTDIIFSVYDNIRITGFKKNKTKYKYLWTGIKYLHSYSLNRMILSFLQVPWRYNIHPLKFHFLCPNVLKIPREHKILKFMLKQHSIVLLENQSYIMQISKNFLCCKENLYFKLCDFKLHNLLFHTYFHRKIYTDCKIFESRNCLERILVLIFSVSR